MPELLRSPLFLLSVCLCAVPLTAGVIFAVLSPKLFLLILKNLRRNLLRTGSTALALAVLVFMLTTIWTVLKAVDDLTSERSRDLKLIVEDRWKNPSMMPLAHAHYLDPTMPQFILNKGD